MPKYLRSEKDRKSAILDDAPDTRFYFESQRYSDIPGYQNRRVENLVQTNGYAAREVRKNENLIDAAAARYSIDPDIVKAVIYTEVARGAFYGKPAEWVRQASTLLPGNIGAEWQKLIPGSDVHNPKDNIELTAKLLSQIAKRLDDPSIENIYSLYNGLSHDRTYVNRETKTTPYFARMAMEARAWERDDWHSPEFSDVNDVRRERLDRERSDTLVGRTGRWGTSPAGVIPQPASGDPASFDQRFESWGSRYAGGGGASNLPPMTLPAFVGPSIPFVSRPNGSLVAPEESSLLDPTPMAPGVSGPFSTGGRFVPRSSSPQPLYPTGALVPTSNGRGYDRQGLLDDRSRYANSSPADDTDRVRSPVLRELQKYRQLAASAVDSAPSSAASNLGSSRGSIGVDSEAGAASGGFLKWIGNGLVSSTEASPSKLVVQSGSMAPGFLGGNDGSISDANEAASPLAKDDRRYLSRRVVGQEPAFDAGAPAVPFVPSKAGLSPDYPNSFKDPFGNRSSTGGTTQAGQPRQASTPLGLLTAQPMPSRVVPLPIFDLLDRSTGRESSADEWESQGTGIPMLDEYIRYVNRAYPT